MAGTISWEDFLSCLSSFIALSEELQDGWCWKGTKGITGGAYAVKHVIQSSLNSDPVTNTELEDLEDSSVDDSDISTVHNLVGGDLHTWEYHILYSLSYGTPVLYFNVWTQAGLLLPLEKLWLTSSLEHKQWETLTQQEHPILRKPFFQLHPCRTAELISMHGQNTANPIVTWLSSVGPVVGLCLHPKYAKLVTTPGTTTSP